MTTTTQSPVALARAAKDAAFAAYLAAPGLAALQAKHQEALRNRTTLPAWPAHIVVLEAAFWVATEAWQRAVDAEGEQG